MSVDTSVAKVPSVGPYELWMIAQGAVGAIRRSPIGVGGGQGGVGAAFALGTITASILAGRVADQIGFESLAAISSPRRRR